MNTSDQEMCLQDALRGEMHSLEGAQVGQDDLGGKEKEGKSG